MEHKKIAIILVGAPGSGKGTQGKFIQERTGLKNYTMSSMIKSVVKEGTEMYKDVFERGRLLNDMDIFHIFRDGFGQEEGVIIDGIPRTIDQAYWLYGYLSQHHYEMKLLYLKVDESKLLDRIMERGRSDDKPEVFKERLEKFDHVKRAILGVYKEKLIEVNGDQDIDLVAKEIEEKLGM